MSGPPDVVMPVRRGEANEELRYALRSLSNVPHGRVWIAGHTPGWVSGVTSVPVTQTRSKYENSTLNLLTACRQHELSEEFVLWNDDIFLLRPVDAVPVYHRGPVREVYAFYQNLARGQYLNGMKATSDILHALGHPHPTSYELHVPMAMRKDLLPRYIEEARRPGMPATVALHKRTLYGNLAGVGGERIEDVKIAPRVRAWQPGEVPFVSTMDSNFPRHPAGAHVRDLYPEPGPYERRKR